ncbi:RdgB/HAM1 family non-canonical purine NTP pyrophosphatase [Aestuariibacter sp. GS-14]|uniref:RdgB/HAM1 family non-canonical purine NTP pyrophosphatase n=1 Tax=Aestuariibacter sp. GS-14 TaxID=2590670 RepID=UPI00112D1759|nr:RdgB/HAM1 family non-canonical purine NTP pyrophosphatase [Aestuariibacter sp. GS-14]TPV56113.1 RdgB/HAM1 family non-canonical purine NTP pyrophosphatase [Aestuariibacter sp. GS-14]
MSFPQKIVLATGNAGKVKEFASLFESLSIEVVPQSALNVSSVPETGTTFVENAIIKARHAARETGLPAIADDSGLVVDLLGGAPGIYSSRYAGEDASDDDNISKLLEALGDSNQRNAHFQCVLVFMRHADDPVPLISEGQWQGSITRQRHGDGGFGYDPVFYANRFKCTAAELTKAQKNDVSHRGLAMQQLLTSMKHTFA